MSPGTSSLNPYAASYIPLSRRGSADANSDSVSAAEDCKSSNKTSHEEYTLKGNLVHGSSSKNSREMTEKQIMDEECDMDLAYLQMTFPYISDESLSDVYLANKGDLEATVEMLNQLEPYTGDVSEYHPDVLDINHVSESGSLSRDPTMKLKEVAGEVAGPPSGSSESASIT
ncbi:hypothetical protein NMG60_11000871 [Bertholletia excelsa]